MTTVQVAQNEKSKQYKRNLLEIFLFKAFMESNHEGFRRADGELVEALDAVLKAVGYAIYLVGPDEEEYSPLSEYPVIVGE